MKPTSGPTAPQPADEVWKDLANKAACPVVGLCDLLATRTPGMERLAYEDAGPAEWHKDMNEDEQRTRRLILQMLRVARAGFVAGDLECIREPSKRFEGKTVEYARPALFFRYMAEHGYSNEVAAFAVVCPWVHHAAPSPVKTPEPPPEAELDEVDAAILNALCGTNHGILLVDLAAHHAIPTTLRRSRNVVAKRCRRLEKEGFVRFVSRKGVSITAAGQARAGKK